MMWKKYMASFTMVFILTPVFCGVLYMHQTYTSKISKKIAIAAKIETFGSQNRYPLLNQSSPFAKMPQVHVQAASEDGAIPAAPPHPYIPVPSSPASYPPQMRSSAAAPTFIGTAMLPIVKSVIFSAAGNNIAIVADGATEVMVETGQKTRWGSVDGISQEGVQINGKFYGIKTI